MHVPGSMRASMKCADSMRCLRRHNSEANIGKEDAEFFLLPTHSITLLILSKITAQSVCGMCDAHSIIQPFTFAPGYAAHDVGVIPLKLLCT